MLFTDKSIRNIQGKIPGETGVCRFCHLLHNSERPDLLALPISKAGRKFPAARSGLTCHAEKTGIAWNKLTGKSHPLQVVPSQKNMETLLPLFNETTGQKEEFGVISCLICHNPHQWDGCEERVRGTAGKEGDAGNSIYAWLPPPPLCSVPTVTGKRAMLKKLTVTCWLSPRIHIISRGRSLPSPVPVGLVIVCIMPNTGPGSGPGSLAEETGCWTECARPVIGGGILRPAKCHGWISIRRGC